jgi:V/A-type H+-transporting ATPase subunit I
MLRPEQMSKVSVTGSKSVMEAVIETVHDMHLVHITEYDGSWEGFEPGTPLEGSDETSSTLVTVRALESILDVTEEDVGATAAVDLENSEERLEEVRTEVNDLDDRRTELEERLREIEEQLERMELFADLDLDLDLLWGYDSLDVLVGEGSAEAVETALAESDDVEAFDVFGDSETVAAFGYMADDSDLSDALVGVPFTAHEVPELTGDPESNVADLESEQKEIEAKLDKVESELEALKADAGAFLLALEEELSIESQKYEAPLQFATTERSFVVEGWVPADRYDEFETEIREAVDDRIEVAELQRAAYTGDHLSHEPVHDDQHDETTIDDDGLAESDEEPAETDEEERQRVAPDGGTSAASGAGSAVTDGGGIVTVEDDPPVIQNNSTLSHPFEVLVKAINRPKYSELDPTILVFLTFPFFFGFMIGDVGYGLLYFLVGTWVARRFDSEGVANLGIVIVWMGLFTVVFGFLYGEVFGLHFLEWPIIDSHPILEKGLTKANWAKTWLIAAVIFGWIQLNIGYIIDFVEEFQLHGAKPAMIESGSWFLMLNGIWVFIFSHFVAGPKPAFLIGDEALLNNGPLGIGFTGFPEIAGIVGLVAFAVGIALILSGPWYEVFEFLVPVVHVLSYTRLTAVLLSKAGMALAANLLYFGVYEDSDGFHFLYAHGTEFAESSPKKELIFGGLSNMGSTVDIGGLTFGIEGALLGLPVLIIAHLVVLAIGGTAALQAIRLEYVEFFEKFYEGGGKNYQPFGYERTYTTDT